MKRLGEAVTLGVIACVSGLIIIILPYGNSMEEKIDLSMLFTLRGIEPPPEDIVIISIDRVSSEMLNFPEDPKKWPRSVHAQLTGELARKGASVIVFDLFFTEAQSERDDAEFARVISKAGNVVLTEYLKMETLVNARGEIIKDMYIEKYLQPVRPLAESSEALACFPLPGMSSINQYWTFRSAGNMPTLPVVLYQLHALKAYDEFIQLFFKYSPDSVRTLPVRKEDIRKYSDIKDMIRELKTRFLEDPLLAGKMMEDIQRAERDYPDSTKDIIRSLIQIYGNASGLNYFNFYGPPRTIATIPYHLALKSGDNEAEVDVRDKVVFIGLSENLPSEIKHAGHPTVFSTSDGIDISGVELAATAYANLSEGRPVRPVTFYQRLSLIIAWGVIAGTICYLPRALVSAVMVSALSLLYLSFAFHQFKANGIWLPLFVPLFVQTPIAVFGSLIRKRSISSRTIRQFLPHEIASRITAGEKLKDLRTIDRTIFGTCLIADIEDFTRTSENRGPEVISRHRKIYFEEVMKPLRQYDVLIEKTTGDGVVAVWKDNPRIDTKSRTCRAAMDMMRAVQMYNRSAAVCFPTRIGMHCGHMHIGLVGAEGHYEYDVTGDTVNTTQRIENLNKLLGTRMLLSEKVKGCPDFLTRYVGSFIFEGKANPVAVHELVGDMKEADGRCHELCGLFMEAFDSFRKRLWKDASGRFNGLIEKFADGPSRFYAGLCDQYLKDPPDTSWEGEIRLNRKY